MKEIRPFSYSQLECYAKCPLSWQLKYIEKLPVAFYDFTGTLPGNVIHLLYDNFFKKAMETGIYDFSIFEEEVDNAFDKKYSKKTMFFHQNAFAISEADARVKIKGWAINARDLVNTHSLNQPFVVAEHRFGNTHSPLKITDNFYMTGGYDYLGGKSKEDVLRLIDYKVTGNVFYVNKKQLLLYALGAIKEWFTKIGLVGFMFVKNFKVEWSSPNQQAINETVAWVENIISSIDKGKFKPTPSKASCKFCDFRDICDHSMNKGVVIPIMKSYKQYSAETPESYDTNLSNLDINNTPEL